LAILATLRLDEGAGMARNLLWWMSGHLAARKDADDVGVIAMRDDRINQRMNRERREKALTLADLCQGIERRLLPARRQGNDYIVRIADARRLRESLARLEQGLEHDVEIAPDGESSTLEVGRPA
jgi:hypothetical protein